MNEQQMPFRHFLVVRNPVSTNAATALRRIAALKRAFPGAEHITVETLPGGRAANAGLLEPYAHKLGPDTLLCIAGGDGTINMVLESLLSDPKLPVQARKTPVLPLWGGNANDLAHMLNGAGRKTDLPGLVRTASVTKVYPLTCTLTDAGGQTATHVAACYISFGASALTAQTLSTTFRARTLLSKIPVLRFIGELLIVVPAMTQAQTFLATEDGSRKTVYEYVFFNGPRFAKIIGVRRQLGEQSFHRALVEHKRLTNLLRSAVALMRPGEADKLRGTHAEFTALEATWVQFDGEAARVYAGTHVVVTVADQPFYALSRRTS
jgi:diacylglycerol kinase family enzyme